MTNAYYIKVVRVISDYLGPASERFVNRQISFHLNKKPDDLTIEDVKKLAEWIRGPLSLIISDKKLVDNASNSLHNIV